MFAHEERDQWQSELRAGVIPDRVRASVSTYKRLRSNKDWRSSGLIESLGEAAIILLERLEKEIEEGSINNSAIQESA